MIKRKTPIKRKTWVPKKPRKRIQSISKRRKAALIDYKNLKAFWMKEVKQCEACHPIHDYLKETFGGNFRTIGERPWALAKIPRPVEDVHHSRGRVGALETDTRFWIGVCRPCHDWIHTHPAASQEILSTAGVPLIGPWNRQD